MSNVKFVGITIHDEDADGYRIAFDVKVKSRPAPVPVIIMTLGKGEITAMVDGGCGYDVPTDDIDAFNAAVMIEGAQAGDRDALKFLGEIAREFADNHGRQMGWAA